MLNFIGWYIVVVILSFLSFSIALIWKENHVLEALLVSFLNVLLLLFILVRMFLIYCVKKKGLNLLGRKPSNLQDYEDMGADTSEDVYSLKNLFRMLFYRMEER